MYNLSNPSNRFKYVPRDMGPIRVYEITTPKYGQYARMASFQLCNTPFSWLTSNLTLGGIERLNQGHCVFIGLLS